MTPVHALLDVTSDSSSVGVAAEASFGGADAFDAAPLRFLSFACCAFFFFQSLGIATPRLLTPKRNAPLGRQHGRRVRID